MELYPLMNGKSFICFKFFMFFKLLFKDSNLTSCQISSTKGKPLYLIFVYSANQPYPPLHNY